MRTLAFIVLLNITAPVAAKQLNGFAGPRVTAPTLWLPVKARPAPPQTWRDLRDIRERIEDGRDERSLTRREARKLKREVAYIGVLTDRFGSDGLSDAERRELDVRTSALRDQVGVRRTQGAGRGRSR